MSESLHEGRGENPAAKQWGDLADQIASHSTVDGNGNTVYLGREVNESERAKVEESGFDKPAEPVRGSDEDRDISEDVYPQLEGESDYDYRARIRNMEAETRRDIEGDAVTDARKAHNTALADHIQDRTTYEDVRKTTAELNRAREDRDYYRSMPEKEALEIARKFGNVESRDSKHAEPARGSDEDRDISEDVYPQLEGESDYDYRARIGNMEAETLRDIRGDAVTDARKAYNTAHADFVQGRVTFMDAQKANKKLDLTKSLHKKGKI